MVMWSVTETGRPQKGLSPQTEHKCFSCSAQDNNKSTENTFRCGGGHGGGARQNHTQLEHNDLHHKLSRLLARPAESQRWTDDTGGIRRGSCLIRRALSGLLWIRLDTPQLTAFLGVSCCGVMFWSDVLFTQIFEVCVAGRRLYQVCIDACAVLL